MSDAAVKALLDYRQADEDGIMVLTSRQAIHEVTARLAALEGEAAALQQVGGLQAERIATLERVTRQMRDAFAPMNDALRAWAETGAESRVGVAQAACDRAIAEADRVMGASNGEGQS